jgi:hypothetical protein
MYFETNLTVTIGGWQVLTVVSVKTSKDGQKIGGYCDLVVPINCNIRYQNPVQNSVGNTQGQLQSGYLTVIANDAFTQGMSVEITANYISEGQPMPSVKIFSGFIYDFVWGHPLTIKCMDYVYFYNIGIFGNNRLNIKSKKGIIKSTGQGVSYSSIKLTTLLNQLIDFVNHSIVNSTTTLENPNNSRSLPSTSAPPTPVALYPMEQLDLDLVNLTFISMSPAAILEWFKKNLGLNISIIDNYLYVNLASNTLNTIYLNTGVNVIQSKLMKELTTFQRIRLKCWFINENGTRGSIEVGDESGIQEENFFYKVPQNAEVYQKLANAALQKALTHKFNGEVETLLYPYCDLYWNVNYYDLAYPERSDIYVVIGVYNEISTSGFHRRLKLGYLTSIN